MAKKQKANVTKTRPEPGSVDEPGHKRIIQDDDDEYNNAYSYKLEKPLKLAFLLKEKYLEHLQHPLHVEIKLSNPDIGELLGQPVKGISYYYDGHIGLLSIIGQYKQVITFLDQIMFESDRNHFNPFSLLIKITFLSSGDDAKSGQQDDELLIVTRLHVGYDNEQDNLVIKLHSLSSGTIQFSNIADEQSSGFTKAGNLLANQIMFDIDNASQVQLLPDILSMDTQFLDVTDRFNTFQEERISSLPDAPDNPVIVNPPAPVQPSAPLIPDAPILPADPLPSLPVATGAGSVQAYTTSTAQADTYTLVRGATLNINASTGLLTNDMLNGNPVTETVLISNVSHGTLTLSSNGSFTYIHDNSLNLADSFSYQILNAGGALSNIVNVNLTITPVYANNSLNWNIATPASVQSANLQLWLDANDLASMTLNGGQATGWNDKITSGTVNNAAAPTFAEAPQYGTSSLGLNTLTFDGVNDIMIVPDANNLDNTTGLTTFVLFTPKSHNGGFYGIISKRVFYNDQASYSSFITNAQNLDTDIDYANNRFTSTSTILPNQNYLLATTFDGSAIAANRTRIDINGTFNRFGNESSTAIPDYASNLSIAALNQGYGDYLNAEIHEIMIFTDNLTIAERQQIERYLATKYGIAINAAVPNANPTFTGGADLDKLAITSGEFQITLNDTSSIQQVEYLDLKGNNAAHAVNVRDTYFTAGSGVYGNILTLDAEANSKAIIFSGALITNAAHDVRFIGSAQGDSLSGGAGNDSLTGGQGADTLKGGGGEDHFIFASGDSGTIATQRDKITDFTVAQQDKVDVSAITSGDATFITTAVFSAGGDSEVRAVQSGADTLVQLDSNGDGVADMEITLTGITATTLTDSQFIL